MIKVDVSSALKGLDKVQTKLEYGLKMYGGVACKMMEGYAKSNAPWENRTGLARKSIKGFNEIKGDTFYIGVSGGMEYSPYLELAMDKKYAVLYPTILEYEQEVLKNVGKILK